MPVPALLPLFTPGIAGTAATGAVGVGGLAAGTASAVNLSALASWGLLGGSFLYTALDRPKGVEGPRMTDFSVRQSRYGLFKPLVWGTMRVDGNVIWPDNAETLVREERDKIKGGLFNLSTVGYKYEYSGNFAVAFGDGECAYIPKIWLNNKPFFDLTRDADPDAWIASKRLLREKTYDWEEEIRIHTGAETETPDAYLESIEGVGTVPAYRGTPYVVFKNILLTYDYSNQIPAVSALISKQGRFGVVDWESIDVSGVKYLPDFKSYHLFEKNGEMFILGNFIYGEGTPTASPSAATYTSRNTIDWVAGAHPAYHGKGFKTIFSTYECDDARWVVGRTEYYGIAAVRLADGNGDESAYPLKTNSYVDYSNLYYLMPPTAIGASHDGRVLCYGGSSNPNPFGSPSSPYYKTLHISENGRDFTLASENGGAGVRTDASIVHDGIKTLLIGGVEHDTETPEHNAVFQFDAGSNTFSKLTADLTGLGQDAAEILAACLYQDFLQEDGVEIFTAVVKVISSNKIVLYQSSDGATWTPLADCVLPIVSVDAENKTFSVSGDVRNRLHSQGRFYIDGSTGNDGEYAISSMTYDSIDDETDIIVDESITDSTADGDLRHYPLIGELSADGYTASHTKVASIFSQLVLVSSGSSENIVVTRDYFLTEETTLQSICEDINDLAGLESSEYDFSELANINVQGHMIDSLTSAKDSLLSFQRAHQFDLAYYDAKIRALLRQSRTPISIDEDDLGAYKDGSQPPGNKIDLQIKNPVDLPRAVEVSYYDVNRDFQQNTQTAFRKHSESSSTKQVNLNVALTDAQARKAAEILLWDAYAERMPVGVNLSYKHQKITPSDILSLSVDGVSYSVRVTQVDTDGGLVRVKGIPSKLEIYDANPPATETAYRGGRTAQRVSTFAALLDIADFRGVAETDFGFWFVAGPVRSDREWPGAQLLRYDPASDSLSYAVTVNKESCLGNADGVLGVPAFYGMQDNSNTVDVEIACGADQLANIPDELMLDDAHLAILGDEIIAFAQVECIGGNVYRFSRLLRGLYGTERAIPTHEINERFALLDNAVRVPMSRREVNVPYRYQIVTNGETANPNAVFAFTCRGMAKKPYAPLFLEAERRADGGWRIEWFGSGCGIWKQYDQSGRPRIEGAENYEIDFLRSTGYPILDVDYVRKGFVIAGDRVSEFTPGIDGITINVSSIVDRSGDFTVLSAERDGSNTFVKVVESEIGYVPDGGVVREILHIQSVSVLEQDPNQKPFFVLPAATYEYADASGVTQKMYGQDRIYGGVADTIRIKVCQIAPTVNRGFETAGTFSV